MAGTATPRKARVNQVLGFRGIERVQLEEAQAGDIVLINGIEELCIGATLADINQPEALPMPAVDEPTLTMNFQVNTSPLLARKANSLPAGNWGTPRKGASDQCCDETGRNRRYRFIPVSGRGELHLTILLESMRREGYELAVSRPHVVLRR